jgi:glycosyltransferase involved in cell wall biosynthesis
MSLDVLEEQSKPRLLQMMLSTQPGGAETFFEKLCFGFAQAGVPQCVVIEPNPEREALLGDFPGVEVRPIHFGGVQDFFARRRLRAVFEQYTPDVALTWMNRASRRVPSGFCPIVGRLGGYYGLKYYKNCDHLVGITPDLVKHIHAGGRAESEASLIPNFGEVSAPVLDPIQVRQSMRAGFGLTDSDTVLLALGRLHEVKAHDTLIRALAELDSVVLLLAGEGPLESELRALAESLGVTSRVHFLGWRRDVSALFASCDISVFPSRYEPNGTVVMESWAQRRPLVASRAKGPEWLVDDGRNGLLFDIDSVAGLVACLRKVMTDTTLAKQLVVEGETKFNSGFSREHIVSQYLALFDQLTA